MVLHAARSISFVRFGAGGGNANSGCMYGVIAMSAHVQVAFGIRLIRYLSGFGFRTGLTRQQSPGAAVVSHMTK